MLLQEYDVGEFMHNENSKPIEGIRDTVPVMDEELVDMYVGRRVKVFYHWGSTAVQGTLERRIGKRVWIRDSSNNKECVINLDWVASTVLMDT